VGGAGVAAAAAAQAQTRPARKPEAVEVTSPKLYVGNLSFDATESDISELFNGVGAVKNVEVVTYKDTYKSKGFGFVTMTALDEAVRAVKELHDKEFMGRRLVVSGAKTNDRPQEKVAEEKAPEKALGQAAEPPAQPQ
jgi:RNA recognition motif-containing protein